MARGDDFPFLAAATAHGPAGRNALESIAGGWKAAAMLAVVLGSLELTYLPISAVRHALTGVTPEAVVAGWWWATSLVWLIDSLNRRKRLSARRPAASLAFRTYVAAAITVLSVTEVTTQGAAGGLGFLAGVGAFGALFYLSDLARAGLRSLTETLRDGAVGGGQLSLPLV